MKPGIAAMCLAATLATAGCALVPDLPSTEPAQVSDMLAFYHRLNLMTPAQQRSEFDLARAAHDKLPNDANRLRLALVLVLPKAPWRDDARASQLLGAMDAVPEERASPRRDLVLLIDGLVSERLRLLREEQRKVEMLQQQTEAFREELRKIEVLQQKLDALREEYRKSDVLQQKLEGLREIDRDQRKRPPRRSTP